MSDLLDLPVTTLHGTPTTFGAIAGGRAALVVNVASMCDYTPQYGVLERLHEEYGSRGFTVIGFPCNQFDAQEPGSADEIAQFCSLTYGVTFPMSAKVDVNGADRDPVFAVLTQSAEAGGEAGDVFWNFAKFLVAPDGEVVARFSPETEPDAPEVRAAIESVLLPD
jgi:glutathione peroxidase